MSLEVALWGIGVLWALASALGFAILGSVQRQGRDTNVKVTTQGEMLAGVVRDTVNVQGELARLRDNVHRTNGEMMKLAGSRELGEEIAKAIVALLEERDARRRNRAGKD